MCIQTTALTSLYAFELIREILLCVMLPLSGTLSPDAYNILSLLLSSNHPREKFPHHLIQNMPHIMLCPFKLVFMASDISLHIYYVLFLHENRDFYLLLYSTPVTVAAWHIVSMNSLINQFS